MRLHTRWRPMKLFCVTLLSLLAATGVHAISLRLQPDDSLRPGDVDDVQARIDKAMSKFWHMRVPKDGDSDFKMHVKAAGSVPDKERLDINGAHGGSTGYCTDSASTYGEITPQGIRTAARAMGMAGPGPGDLAFVDLGSGLGRFVVQAFLEFPKVASSVGVELSETRWKKAGEAWEALKASRKAEELRSASSPGYPVDLDQVRLLQGDMLEADLSTVTHIFVNSPCFSHDLMHKLSQKLESDGTKLQTVATFQKFPNGLQGFSSQEDVNVEVSWILSGYPLHVYQRQAA